MISADVIFPVDAALRWHDALVQRLRAAGHDVEVVSAGSAPNRNRALEAILSIEHRLTGQATSALTAPIAVSKPSPAGRSCDLVIDLSHTPEQSGVGVPALTVLFDGRRDLSSAAAALCRGKVPVIDLHLDGVPVRHAAPMADSRAFIYRGLHDVLARAITLIVDFVNRYHPTGNVVPNNRIIAGPDASGASVARSYLTHSLPRLAGRALHRLLFHGDHWRVGYRFIDGPGVAETGSLAGAGWNVLPDRGDRFYADPFPFEWNGRYFIFVEELVHSAGTGVISVSECDPSGHCSVPRRVLEEPFHLSYPQVFARDEQVWMIPEAGADRKVVLYRAREFPDVWVEEKVLVADREIVDATLLEHGGLLWLFGAERDGAGSASDTLVVFFSERLEGPWQPHPLNPVLIDKSAARPGGGFARVGGRIVLPVQDGSVRYGGGLGMSQLLGLDARRVELSQPVPVDATGYWPYPRIHTLNRHDRLETIDGLAPFVRRVAR